MSAMRPRSAGEWNLRLASYNIRKAVGLDWKRKPERVLAVLDEIGADVVVLQEADKRLGNRPAAITFGLLASHGVYDHLDHGPGPSLGWRQAAPMQKRWAPAAFAAAASFSTLSTAIRRSRGRPVPL